MKQTGTLLEEGTLELKQALAVRLACLQEPVTDADPGQLRAFEQRVDANMGSKWSIPAFLAGWLAFYTGREAGLCRFQLRLAF